MKTVVAAAAGLALLAGLAGPADAGARSKKPRAHANSHAGEASRPARPRAQEQDSYYEHIADKLPIGSSIWWDQMMRERRGGRPG